MIGRRWHLRWFAVVVFGITLFGQARVPIYVALPTRDGFIDATRDILDSQKDLRAQFAKLRTLALAQTPEAATLVLTVIGRGHGPLAFGTMTRGLGSGIIVSEPTIGVSEYWVLTVLRVGDYQKTLTCQITDEVVLSPWSYCATVIVKDVETWVKLNAAQLVTK